MDPEWIPNRTSNPHRHRIIATGPPPDRPRLDYESLSDRPRLNPRSTADQPQIDLRSILRTHPRGRHWADAIRRTSGSGWPLRETSKMSEGEIVMYGWRDARARTCASLAALTPQKRAGVEDEYLHPCWLRPKTTPVAPGMSTRMCNNDVGAPACCTLAEGQHKETPGRPRTVPEPTPERHETTPDRP